MPQAPVAAPAALAASPGGWQDRPVNSTISRTLTAAAAAFITVLLAGCSGVNSTNRPQPPPAGSGERMQVGVNADGTNHSVGVRDVLILYPGPQGYQAGESAPF